jgi:hypothetical protein
VKNKYYVDEETGKKVYVNKDGSISKRQGSPLLYKGMKGLNPKGREKGSVNKMTKLSRALMTEKGPEIVKKVIDMAMGGDVHCLKMCIDRILPVHKAIDPSKAKNDAQIIINVGASNSIKAQIAETPTANLVNPETKEEDAVIIEVGETVG